MNMDTRLLFGSCVALFHLAIVGGYITGAPLQSCNQMEPGHGEAVQTINSPYNIATSSSTYTCKQDIAVTLSGTAAFKGFQCQARTAKDTFQTYGSFVGSGTVQTTNNCGSNVAAITHKDNNNKQTVTFTWKPYITNETNIYIVCTFVQEYKTYWVRQPSAAIRFVHGGDCNPDAKPADSTSNASASRVALLIGVLICALI